MTPRTLLLVVVAALAGAAAACAGHEALRAPRLSPTRPIAATGGNGRLPLAGRPDEQKHLKTGQGTWNLGAGTSL